ncbi:tetratricopeptide repeat protein [Oscillatoria sp. CS-180]|uniref:tetratricopeptide repeat protein n=1 Tax=Oscillatoria sp. CS-180 TaxID=3021720 RepID=UPI00232A9ED6|nr:tetratricopeptide repeat protein [Oscillatoria sp. CS-180]MDB9527251.1 tetratricopeptide repeat protein [Oscillatoria sp. CS-180]
MSADPEALLNDLKDPDSNVRQVATESLWRRWYTQKGAYGAQILVQSQTMLDEGQVEEAEALLSKTIKGMPDFAEAWNRRAVLYYLQQRYWQAISDCEQVLALVPYHFGALHGMGLCHAGLGNHVAAIQFFRRALEVQPYSTLNERLILECTAKLS